MSLPSEAHGGLPLAVDATHLGAERADRLTKVGVSLAIVGVLLGIGAAFADPHRFAFSYLTGFMWVVTLGLGGLFFVLLQHVTRAGWSVGPRRQMEWLAGILPIAALLFIPLIALGHFEDAEGHSRYVNPLWEHWMGHHALTDKVLQRKAGYLNVSFFFVRAIIFFVAWTALSMFFNRSSRRQDETGDPALTLRMQFWSAPSIFVFALTLTFAAFDWLMSLDPHWYSTIFGVYIFAGAVTSSFALLALMTIGLQKTGLISRISTVEHRHDIGKLLFGFTIFWAYIAFSQFFLIWYANIPEETIFFLHRWEHGWKPVSLLLLFGHFWFPFFLLLSRHAKRHVGVLAFGAAWHLFMHYVDLYWIVLPNYDVHFHFSWIDVAGLLAPLGVLALWLARRASRDPLYPVKDPRIAEAVQFVNQ